jgi:hypothetical protein
LHSFQLQVAKSIIEELLENVIRTVAPEELQADDEPTAEDEPAAKDKPAAEAEHPANVQEALQIHYVIPDRTQPPALDQPPSNNQPAIDDGAVVAYTEQRWRYTLPYAKLEVHDILAFSKEDKSLQFVCNFCRENFPTYEEMQVHRGAHLGEGPIDPVTGLPMSPSSVQDQDQEQTDLHPQVYQYFNVVVKYFAQMRCAVTNNFDTCCDLVVCN